MADVGQLLLQSELFVALGATLFAALPAISSYWLPVIYPNSAPEQFQLSSDAAIATTVTRTATVFPKPTTLTDKVYQTIVQMQTATRTATTTATVPKTIFATVTEQVTSVSTYYDRNYLTKWTHLSVDPATPCTTMFCTPDVTIQSRGTPVSGAHPRRIATLPTTTPEASSWIPCGLFARTLILPLTVSLVGHFIMWFWNPRVSRLLGDVQVLQKTLEARTKSRQNITDKYQTDQADFVKIYEKAEKLTVMVQARDIMLQKLGVTIPDVENGHKELDEHMIANMVQARMNVLVEEKQQLDRLEKDNKGQLAEIKGLEETIKTRLSDYYVPGVRRSFDSLLYDKQIEINKLREAIHNSDLIKNIKEDHVFHQKKHVELGEKDTKLSELQPLREEVGVLREALVKAKEENVRIEEEKRAKSIADERRWSDARAILRKEQSGEIRALKERHTNRAADLESRLEEKAEEINTQRNKIAILNAQLHKARCSPASSHETQQPRSSHRANIEAPRQRFTNVSSEQNVSTESDDYFRRELVKADQDKEKAENNLKFLSKLYQDALAKQETLENQNAEDEKHCTNEKNLLRQRVAELEKILKEAAQKHDSQSYVVTGPLTDELQPGSTTPESSSRANEAFHEQLKKQVVDLRAQVASLSKDVQVKEVKEGELSTQISTSRAQLEAKLAQEQAVSTQVATLVQQRDTTMEENTDVKKQLEEAISKGEAVWSELRELKGTNTDLQVQCDRLHKQGVHEINSRDQQIFKLQTDVTTGNQAIGGLEQQLSVLKAANENGKQVIYGQQATINAVPTQAEALKKELRVEKDRYLIDVNGLKNDIDHLERELEKEQDGRKNDVKLAREREAKAIDDERRKRQQEINDLKNSQDSSTIKKLQKDVEDYKMENTDLRANGKKDWMNILLRKENELRKRKAELDEANGRIRHWHRLYNLFHRKAEGLERNQKYKAGEVTYTEARAGLFMGSDVNISDAMEKCVKLTEYLEARVASLDEELDRLRKYDEQVVEEEMDMYEKME
ncbi:hypothetical protein G6011_00708 [Alternaria panax]|uniref:Uncharacterized protein n=1 Tax=Alternaria panax TaxID=48097 RepID=A0AAD4IJ91_9PLEO|nr:hypothetical protein G6011_00708 [Alternaria panax]